jgi:N-acyl-D-aspartate/D-glutamate deacylase
VVSKCIQDRGRAQEGVIADLTIFKPDTVMDKADYVKSTLPSEGILHVLVSSVFVVSRKVTMRRTNQDGHFFDTSRCPSRREPLKEDWWKKIWTIAAASLDFGGTYL